MIRIVASLGGSRQALLSVELSFYRLAHVAGSWPDELRRMRQLIESGLRSPSWRLERDVALAQERGHPAPALLAALAKVITEGTEATMLEGLTE